MPFNDYETSQNFMNKLYLYNMYVPIFTIIIDDAESYEIDVEFSCSCEICKESCPCKNRFAPENLTSNIVDLPIFECNQNCRCIQCYNRQIQTAKIPKVIVKESSGKGFGVFALENIGKGTFVGEYAGRVVHKDTQGEYVFQLKENTPSRVIITTVDAQYYGNFTRFFNHSCEPNLDIKSVRTNSIIPHIAFFALKDINPGEELCFTYREESAKYICLCGTSSCKGFF